MKPITDPYRVLGVPRGGDVAQIKSAHRRLAKRFHPDGSTGDEKRFLAVQDAYQLLSDPARRRDWDRRHSARPMDASDRTGPGRARTSSTRSSDEGSSARRRRPRSRRERRRDDAYAEGSGRDPRTRRYTWSAEGVPWWEDFSPRNAGGEEARTTTTARPETAVPPIPVARPTTTTRTARPDFDVYNRSSGAAWSMAARRHFRAGDVDLPSRGAFRYRGTQVVTGAEARKVAAEEAAADTRARTAEQQQRANEEALARRKAQSVTSPGPAAQYRPPGPADARDSHPSPPPPTPPVPTPRPPDDAAVTAARGDQAMLGIVVGAIITPVAVLTGAAAAGVLEGAPDVTLGLLLITLSSVGGAIGRSLMRRRYGATDLAPEGGDIRT